MHGGELLWHRWSLSCHGCLRHWAVLRGIGDSLLSLLNGSVSSVHKFDELQQLSYGHIFGLHWSVVIRKLRGMHGRKLLWYEWPLGRHGCMSRRTIFGCFFIGLH
jgi:hypothetical protein